MQTLNPELASELTTDREGNEICKGDIVWVETDAMTVRGVVTEVEIYRVLVQINDESFVWAHVADTVFSERR